MRKGILTVLSMLVMVCATHAVPARPGLWKTILTSDGTELRVQLCGDEHHTFWKSTDGRCFTQLADGSFTSTVHHPTMLTAKRTASSRRLSKTPYATTDETNAPGTFTGRKKGLIILAQFPNKHFAEGNGREYYDRVANERNFSEGSYKGSVKDYFLSQSYGQFELDFDVVGPVTVSQDYEYYGQPGTTNVDAHPWEMVVEACDLVASQVSFADYDWDGDGYVEQVFVLYAGQGQSDSYDVNTIWPHEYELSSIVENGVHIYGNGHRMPDGLIIDTYACSNELTSQNGPSGIGTICHEFSHCMGLPDLYDVEYNGNFGMGRWDIMALGVYNGNAFIPAAYTSYERMVCGWQQPIELTNDTTVSNMKALSEDGYAYIIYNKGYQDEYYLLENRQQTGWDAGLPSSGLLVLHVDYDERVWRENIVNSVCDYSKAGLPDRWNTHQRLTIIPADNENDKRFWRPSSQTYSQTTEYTDTYPYLWSDEREVPRRNDSLTNNSLPAATVYNANTDNSLYMNRGIQQITQNDDGSMSFRFEAVSEKYVATDSTMTEKPDITGAIFYESFDRCTGTGGNDGVFKGSSDVASGTFLPDNSGWDSMVMGGGARCAKFGNAANDGIVTSPAIMLSGDSLQLSFKAAPWSRDDTSLQLSVTGDAQLQDTQFNMAEGQWTQFSTILIGSGQTNITFTPGRRFFLDEVLVKPVNNAGQDSRIDNWENDEIVFPSSVYDLQGRKLPANTASFKKSCGILLIKKANGDWRKKVISH